MTASTIQSLTIQMNAEHRVPTSYLMSIKVPIVRTAVEAPSKANSRTYKLTQ